MSTPAQLLRVEVGSFVASPSPPADGAERCAPLGNRLLARLPEGELKRLLKHLQPMWLLAGETLDLGGAAPAAIFPVQAILSLRTRHADGCSVEFGTVGREGFFGFALFGGGPSPAQAMVSTAGLAYALPAERLFEEHARGGELARMVLEQGNVLLAQAAILCGCHRRHSLEQQVARWLLTSFDRLRGNELTITQEMIASLLGVRREGVTEAARRLQNDGLIQYRRGHVFLLQRAGLAARACECYEAIHAQLERQPAG